MNPYAVRVALRRRTSAEVLDLAAVLLRAHAGALLRLGLIVLVPFQLVMEGLGVLAEEPWLGAAVAWLGLPFVQLPFLLFGARALFESDVPLVAVARDLSERRWEIAGLLMVTSLMLTIVSCSAFALSFMMLPLIYLPQTVLLERRGVLAGASRAVDLIGAHFGMALVGALVVTGASCWGALVGEGTGQAMVGFVLQLGEPFGALDDLDRTPYLLTGLLWIQPLLAFYQLLLYLNARTIAEGWDVQLAVRGAAEEG